jgi:anti-sigma factor RsiW
MTCEEFAQALTAFSLCELDPTQTQACNTHLAGCAACTNLSLRDHQLVSMLRASAVPAPAAVHHAVTVSLRHASREQARRRRPLRVAMAGIAAAAAVLAFVVLSFNWGTPEEEAQTPLTAAWAAYRASDLQFDPSVEVPAHLLTKPLPDLAQFGLFPKEDGALRLAGEPALATDFRDRHGGRFAVFRWEGELPNLPQSNPGADPPSVITSSWEGTTSAWFDHDGVVFCAVGNLPRAQLDAAVDHLRVSLRA